MTIYKLFVGTIISFCLLSSTSVFAQGGDQIVDGIGETALKTRYIFTRDANDKSRNNLHGEFIGPDYNFADDSLFRRTLSFYGNTDTYISLPGETMTGEESISISGWIYLRSDNKGQVYFDFGRNAENHLFFAPAGTKNQADSQVQLVKNSEKYVVKTPALELNKWNHISIVFNAPSKTLGIYINGSFIDKITDVDVELKDLFDVNSENNQLYIGKSLTTDDTGLNAKLFDFRIYRIPLTKEQIATIYKNRGRRNVGAESAETKSASDLPEFPKATPQLYNAYLSSVSDIQVETEVGILPKLPRTVKGIYKDNIEGPEVIVLWPAPKDNSSVIKAGTYTITGKVSGTDIQPKAIVTVKECKGHAAPHRTLEGFDLDQVYLNKDINGYNTKFIENRDKFINGLAKVNPDNFLYMFRNAYGKEQPQGAVALKVWDSQTTKLRGHATGHYLTALAQAYAGTAYNKELQADFAEKIEYMVNTLYELSQLSGKPQTAGGEFISDPTAVPPGPGKTDYDSDLSVEGIRSDYWNWGKGYISAYPPDQFIMLEHGARYGTGDNQIWAPYYTLHKILAGLMDIYEINKNEKALKIVKGMGDWVYARLSQVPTDTLIKMWDTYIAGEFGGMNEAMARLYRLTKEPNYLETAQLFDNISVFFGDAAHSGGLAKNIDSFRGLHANQHIPQIVGAIEMYLDSNDPDYYHIADNFWDLTTNDYMYSIGGVAGSRHNPNNSECFIPEPQTLYEHGFNTDGQNETCATYNMLKLTKNLFMFDQRPELMDYYERGLYNHILASVDEHTPANTYHVPLRMGSVKHFTNGHMTGFTCCNGTALESSTKLQNSIYFKSEDNKALYVNLFIPSTLFWKDKNVTITQTTAYPKEDHTQLTIKGAGKFDVKVRVPHWATKGFFVKINGKDEKVNATPGSYLTLSRKWKDGDTIELRMPFKFYLEPVMDQQNVASLFYGPVILAAQEKESLTEWRKVSLDAKDISKSITGDPKQLIFNIDGVVFKPFYDTYGRHSVYLNVELK